MWAQDEECLQLQARRCVVTVQSLSCIWLFVASWTVTCQVLLSFTISWSLLRFTSIQSVMVFNHLILCHPLLLLPSIFPSIRVFSSESALWIRWSKYWTFSFSISPSNEYSGLISSRIDWFAVKESLDSLQSKGLSRVFFNTIVQKHQFFDTQASLWSNCHIHTWLLENHSFGRMDLCQQSNVSAF